MYVYICIYICPKKKKNTLSLPCRIVVKCSLYFDKLMLIARTGSKHPKCTISKNSG